MRYCDRNCCYTTTTTTMDSPTLSSESDCDTSDNGSDSEDNMSGICPPDLDELNCDPYRLDNYDIIFPTH